MREVMDSDPATFQPEDKADEAAGAFERYDLISAPVVDAKGKLMGRLTIERSSTPSTKRATPTCAAWAV